MSAGSWGSWSEGMGGGHTGGPEGVSGQRHNEPRARQHTSSPSKAGVPVLLAPSARCAHSGSGSGASTRSRGRGAYPRPAPQPRSQPRRLLCANPTNLLRPAQEPSSTLSRGEERALQWPPQASAPVLQGGGSPSRQLAGALGGLERRRNATCRLKPQQVHRRGQRRTALWAGLAAAHCQTPSRPKPAKQAPAPPHVKMTLPAAATQSQTHITLDQSPGKPTAGETRKTYTRRDSRGCALRRT